METLSGIIGDINSSGAPAQIAASAIILLFFAITGKPVSRFIVHTVISISKKMKASAAFENLMLSLETTLKLMYIFAALYAVAAVFKIYTHYKDLSLTFLRVYLIIAISVGIYNFLNTTPSFIGKISHKTGVGLDNAIASFITNILKFSVVLLDTVLILSEFGYDISGFVAGLGIGGLAFALAAKDTAANIFGGIVIFLDKTFSIGDWIQIPGVEGIVENVTLRSTRIRTFSDSIAIVPNSVLTQQIITNCERMNKRRVNFSIFIPYTSDVSAIQNCLKKIRETIESHSQINREMQIAVLDKFSETGMELLINYYTDTVAYEEYHRIKEEINYKIIEIFSAEGVAFATYPKIFHQNT